MHNPLTDNCSTARGTCISRTFYCVRMQLYTLFRNVY